MADISKFTFNIKGRRINSDRIKDVWDKYFSDKPFPSVMMFETSFKNFQKAMKDYCESHPERDRRMKEAELKEYGAVVNKQFTSAFVVNTNNGYYLILRSRTSSMSFEDDVMHELNHIYKKEL
jgi:hypothetical protein